MANYIKGKGEIITEFVEVETGTNKRNRTEIYKAIELTRKLKGQLVIAKLDRLSRNVHFVSSLLESNIDFIACDMPTANRFTIHIFAALAEQEARLISERTKAALAELKEKGKKLGTPGNLNHAARLKGMRVRTQNALSKDSNVKSYAFAKLLKEKHWTLNAIAAELNRLGYNSSRGSKFRATTVKRLFQIFENKL